MSQRERRVKRGRRVKRSIAADDEVIELVFVAHDVNDPILGAAENGAH